MSWLRDRLKEPSTYRGLAWILTTVGIALAPEQIDAIAAVGMAVAGLLGVLLPETTM